MTGKQLVKLLESNGWTLDRIKGSHHILKKGGAAISVPVHGNTDLKKGTEAAILKQAGLK
jgi:predicted RNA binding protein YcfA (HicA-like mRNA interferase family)